MSIKSDDLDLPSDLRPDPAPNPPFLHTIGEHNEERLLPLMLPLPLACLFALFAMAHERRCRSWCLSSSFMLSLGSVMILGGISPHCVKREEGWYSEQTSWS